jgi:hypothetical protein
VFANFESDDSSKSGVSYHFASPFRANVNGFPSNARMIAPNR